MHCVTRERRCYVISKQVFKMYFIDIYCKRDLAILRRCKLYIRVLKFKVCKSMHHHTIPINQPTRCNNFSSLLPDVYVQLNMFRASSRPSSGAYISCSSSLWFYRWSVVVAVLLVVVGLAGRPDHDQQHCYHHVCLTRSTNYTSNNLPRMKNQRLSVQF